MIIKESNITINVRELDKSISFYESISLIIKNRWGMCYAQLTAPGIMIGLHQTTEANLSGNSGNTSIGFTVSDFEEAKSLLKNLSIPTTYRQEEGGLFLHFKVPDGTELYFIEPKMVIIIKTRLIYRKLWENKIRKLLISN